jgi:DNA polymerase alpha subunit A
MEVCMKMQVIPLTKSLTTICGNTWIRSLQNARAERNEMLLMHEFTAEGFILPDKRPSKLKEEGD